MAYLHSIGNKVVFSAKNFYSIFKVDILLKYVKMRLLAFHTLILVFKILFNLAIIYLI